MQLTFDNVTVSSDDPNADLHQQAWLSWLRHHASDQSGSLDAARAVTAIRTLRNRLLAESDWTQQPDAKLNTLQALNWSAYRQQLRELPNNLPADLTTLVWPMLPDALAAPAAQFEHAAWSTLRSFVDGNLR